MNIPTDNFQADDENRIVATGQILKSPDSFYKVVEVSETEGKFNEIVIQNINNADDTVRVLEPQLQRRLGNNWHIIKMSELEDEYDKSN